MGKNMFLREIQRCPLNVFSLAALELLEELRTANVRLSIDSQDLIVTGHLTDEWRKQIRQNKPELMRLVQAGEHRWRKLAEWEFTRNGDRMFGTRLDAPGEKSWTLGGSFHGI